MFFCSQCNNVYDISSKNQVDKMLFVCHVCGNVEEIKPGTKIMSKSSSTSTYERVKNLQFQKELPVLNRTRDYICPNKECPTRKYPETREAVMNRIERSYSVRYTCTVCDTTWTNS